MKKFTHEKPVKRTAKISSLQKQTNFIIFYESVDDQSLDGFRKYNQNIDFEISPRILINKWLKLNEMDEVDQNFNILTMFIWELHEYIKENKETIFFIKDLAEEIKLNKITELILNTTFESLVKHGHILEILDDGSRWKYTKIFSKLNHKENYLSSQGKLTNLFIY